MSVNFKDYVHESCDNARYSWLSIVQPNKLREVYGFKFEYYMAFDLFRIKQQAIEFANEFLMVPRLVTTLTKNFAGNYDERKRAIENMYMYSYAKTYNLCVQAFKNEGIPSGNPMANSLAFGGHVELFKNVMDTYTIGVSTDGNYNTSISKFLYLREEDIELFYNSEFYKIYNQSSRKFVFQNSEFERLLTALKEYNSDLLWIRSFDDDIYTKNSRINPLGNCCYTVDENCTTKELMVVNNNKSFFDVGSKFWNTANCIYISKSDPFFARCDNSPFLFVNSNLLVDELIYGEIYSISGIDCKSKFSTYGRDPFNDDDSGPSSRRSGPKSPEPPVNPSDSSDKGRRPLNPKNFGVYGPSNDPKHTSKFKRITKSVGDIANLIKDSADGGMSIFERLSSNDIVKMAMLAYLSKGHNNQIEYVETIPREITTTRTRIGNDFLPIEHIREKTSNKWDS